VNAARIEQRWLACCVGLGRRGTGSRKLFLRAGTFFRKRFRSKDSGCVRAWNCCRLDSDHPPTKRGGRSSALDTATLPRQVGRASSLPQRVSCPRTKILGLEAPQADRMSAPLIWQRVEMRAREYGVQVSTARTLRLFHRRQAFPPDRPGVVRRFPNDPLRGAGRLDAGGGFRFGRACSLGPRRSRSPESSNAGAATL